MDMLPAEARERALTAPLNLMREEQRCEARIGCGGQSATLFVRGRASVAQAINISPNGTMLETAAQLAVDEHVVVAFAGCTPIHATVRWMKDGRVGLHFGREMLLA
jgi:trans-aconitate methyltransferase